MLLPIFCFMATNWC